MTQTDPVNTAAPTLAPFEILPCHDRLVPDPEAKVVDFRPGAYFWRVAIRSARNPQQIRIEVDAILEEWRQLLDWSRKNGLSAPEFNYSGLSELVKNWAGESEGLREVGLAIVLGWERLRAWIKAGDMDSPKWTITHAEAVARGWSTGADGQRSPLHSQEEELR